MPLRIAAAVGKAGIERVAEGVETQEQLNFLIRKRCETVQGFLFAKAVPISEFARTVRRIHAENHIQTPQYLPLDEAPAKAFAGLTNVRTSAPP